MRLTEEQLIEDEERWHARNVIHELEYCSRYIRDRRDITNLDLHFYMWLFRNALKMITAQKHGKWLDMGDHEQCSACRSTHLKEFQSYYGKATWVKTPYCPYCGAKMDPIEER